MRKYFSLLVLLFSAPLLAQQNSNTVTVTVVAVPAAPVISVTPLNYYQNTAATMTITVSSGGVSASCTGTWDTTALSLTFTAATSTTPAKFTAPVTAAMTATLGTHNVLITCPLPVLSLNSPVTLPNAAVGQSYSANLGQIASVLENGQPCTTCQYAVSSGSLPTGLVLSSSGAITGTPSSSGSFNFGFTVSDATNGTANPSVALNWMGDNPMIDNGTSTVLFYSVYRRNTALNPIYRSIPIRSWNWPLRTEA